MSRVQKTFNEVVVLEVPPTHSERRHSVRSGLIAMTRFILSGIPTVVVLLLAGGVGWWGHHNEWKVPKFSQLNGEVEEADDWCKEHHVPESICIICKPELAPEVKSWGWCKSHGIPECTLCHPELVQLSDAVAVTDTDLERAKRALNFTARSENNPICKTHQRLIQFTSNQDVEKAGIAVQPVGMAPALEFISAPGEIGYDPTRVVHLSSRLPGSVWRAFKHLGEPVKQGDVLALIDAAEVGKTKAELLQAFGLLQLKLKLLASVKNSDGAIQESRLREVESAVKEIEIRVDAARQGLVNLGLPLREVDLQNVTPDQLKAKLHFLAISTEIAQSLDLQNTTSNLLPLIAPMDGVIVSRDVVAGEVVDSARILYEVVDTRQLWIKLDVSGEDARRLKLGQPVRFTPDSGNEELTGKLAWISTQADPKTRTVKVRVDLPNLDGEQRANTFGTGKIILRDEPAVVSIPNDAVQWEGCCNVVFVRDKSYLQEDAPKVFYVRKVRTGVKTETQTEIIAGLQPGEVIVTRGSGVLQAELSRANLGAGCCGK